MQHAVLHRHVLKTGEFALYTATPGPKNSTCVLCDGLEVGTCQHCLQSSNYRVIAVHDALATALQLLCNLR